MAEREVLRVEFDSAFINGLYDLPAGKEAELLPEEASVVVGSIIKLVSISGIVTQDGEGFGELHITSLIDLEDDNPNYSKLSKLYESSSRINEDQESDIEIIEPYQYPDLGIVNFSSRSISRMGGVIMPLHGGGSWIIRSVLEDYRWDGETDRGILEKFIGQHAAALTLVVSFIADKYTEYDSESMPEAVVLPLCMPAETVKTQETGPVTDPFAEFIGIDEVIEDLKDMIFLADLPTETVEEQEIEIKQAVLLYGPSGTGKTAVISALGEGLCAAVIDVSIGEVGSRYVNDVATRINKIFKDAYKSQERVLIVMDEFDGLVNSGNEGVDINITSVLKKHLEEIKNYPGVFVAIATNDIDMIDPVLLADKRVPIKHYIGLPGDTVRSDLFASLLFSQQIKTIDSAHSPLDNHNAQKYDIPALVKATEGFSHSDICEIVKTVRGKRVLTALRNGSPVNEVVVSQAELMEGVQKARESKP